MRRSRGLPFAKLNASGNDFVLVERRQLTRDPAELARQLCRRRLDLGADGLVTWALERGGRAEVLHYEPTGERTFCLNAVRCVATWLQRRGAWRRRTTLLLDTDGGPIEAQAWEPPALALPPPRRLTPLTIEVDGREYRGTFLDVGNPQFVVPLEDTQQLEASGLMEVARALRWSDSFPDGANVDFVAPDGPRWSIRTYERGVEDETLSCGSGVVASACAVWSEAAPRPQALRFLTRAGVEQRIVLEEEAGRLQRVWSSGPVAVVAQGELLAA